MDRKEFKSLINLIFLRKRANSHVLSHKLVDIGMALFDLSFNKDNFASQKNLTGEVYGRVNEYSSDAFRKNLKRFIERISENRPESSSDGKLSIYVSKLEDKDEIARRSMEEDGEVNFYKLHIQQTTASPVSRDWELNSHYSAKEPINEMQHEVSSEIPNLMKINEIFHPSKIIVPTVIKNIKSSKSVNSIMTQALIDPELDESYLDHDLITKTLRINSIGLEMYDGSNPASILDSRAFISASIN